MTSAASNNASTNAGRRTDFESVRMAHRRCLTCDREPAAGELMTAVLVEVARRGSVGTEFQRLNYCPTCWPNSPWTQGATALLDEGQSTVGPDVYGAPPVAIWTVRVAPPQRKRRHAFVDDSVLVNFFLRLADDPDNEHQRFRFVLMLILLRHRKLRHEGTDRSADGDAWRVRLMPAMANTAGVSPEEVFAVVDPRMNEEQIGQVADQLSQILQDNIDTDTDEGGPP